MSGAAKDGTERSFINGRRAAVTSFICKATGRAGPSASSSHAWAGTHEQEQAFNEIKYVMEYLKAAGDG